MENQNFYYIKNGQVMIFNEQLDPEYFRVGETYSDYKKGLFVPLNEEQIQYYQEHNEDTVELIWNLGVIERNIEDVRRLKLLELNAYDNSSYVNNFTINNIISAWFTPTERSNYSNSIQAAKLLGQEILIFAIGENILQVPTEKAELMLAAIQLYADSCYMITKQHEIAINKLDSIEAIDNYDITTLYPEKLNFNLV